MRKYKCGFCGTITEANPRITMNQASPPRKNGSEPVICKNCMNFIHLKRGLVK